MNNWQKYEAMKAEWVKSHPGATPAEYEAAIRAIALRCRV
jgi:putative hemolysin